MGRRTSTINNRSNNRRNNNNPTPNPNALGRRQDKSTTAAAAAATAGWLNIGGGQYIPASGYSGAVIRAVAAATNGVAVTGPNHLAMVSAADVPKCHLHTKPLLSCKFCRKYKMAVHQQAKLAQMHEWANLGTDKRDCLEMTNTTSYNLNPLLRENVLSSEYFKSLYQYSALNEIMAEIRQYVDHAEPYVTGHSRAPSTFICCLYKLFTMRLTEDELLTLVEDDNEFVRVAGFLWLRFVHPPEKLWAWYESVLLDEQVFIPSADKSAQNEIPMGKFVESLLSEDRYFATVLPRLPAKVRMNYMLQLQTLEEHRRRKRKNFDNLWKFKKGAEVMACYKRRWRYGCFVDFYGEDETSQMYAMIKFDEAVEDDSQFEEDSVPIDLGLVIVLSRKNKRRKLELEQLRQQKEEAEEEEKKIKQDNQSPNEIIISPKNHTSPVPTQLSSEPIAAATAAAAAGAAGAVVESYSTDGDPNSTIILATE